MRTTWRITFTLIAIVAALFVFKTFDFTRVSLPLPRKGPLTCDFAAYKKALSLSPHHPVIPRDLINSCTRVMYNRVPKCASRTLMFVFTKQSKVNKYASIFIDRQYTLSRQLYNLFVKRMNSVENDRFVLTSHFYFSDFTGYYSKTLIFINVLRDPVTWFESVFNFHKYDARILNRPTWTRQTTASDCAKNERCSEKVRIYFSPMRFLCGQSNKCSVNSEWTRDRALRRLDEDYLVVGVYEKLRQFTEVLEFLMPHIFNGLPHYFDQYETTFLEWSVTVKKDPLSSAAKQELRKTLSYEYDVYNAVREKFSRMYDAMRKLKG